MSTVQRFALPDLGEGLTDADLVAWRVAVGDVVELNQVLAEVETEKAVVELPSPFAGTVVELLAAAGDTVDVGAPLIAIDTAAAGNAGAERNSASESASHSAAGTAARAEEKVPMLVGYGPSEAPPSRRRRNGSGHRERIPPEKPTVATPTTPTTPAAPTVPTRPLAAPPVRFMARQNGVDLADVTGNGPGGIITREDLAAHLAGSGLSAADEPERRPEPERESRTPVRGVQKRMAEAMTRSVATAPRPVSS